MPGLTILEAMDDPALFRPHFRSSSWEAWRAFLAALFALPLSEGALDLYQRHTGRNNAPEAPFAEAALVVGRRGGKSRVLALIAVYLAAFRDYEPHLAPGEVATIAVIAADRRQARSIMRYVTGLLEAVPLLRAMVEDASGDAVQLNNRVVIEVGTASFRTTRGYSFAAVLADEVAFWRQDESSANPDVEILRALRPGMASITGAMLLLASSPYAKRGELYAAFRRHHGIDGAPVLVWKASTAEMNPRIDPAIIAEAYERDPEAARAEYGAEFREDLADFVTVETVQAVTAIGRSELPPEPGVTYTAFVDPSGGAADAMTLAIGHLTGQGVVVLDAVREVRPPFSPEAVVADFAALLRAYGVATVVGDRYGGEWPRQRFREHGIQYMPSAMPKSDLYANLLPLLNARRVELLAHHRLAAQLVGLERRTARSGKDSIDHGPGGHDDVANAVAGVLVGLDLDRRPALVRASSLTVGGQGVTLPTHCNYLMSMTAIAQDGMVATVFGARCTTDANAKLYLADFLIEPLSAGLCQRIVDNFAELTRRCRPTHGIIAQAPAALASQGERLSQYALPHKPWVQWNETPPELELLDLVAVCSAALIAEGHVKTTVEVMDKASASPWGGALDFRAGDAVDTPLRTAVLQTVYAALWGSLDVQAAA